MALPGFAALAEGTHTAYFMVTDQAGNSTGDGGPPRRHQEPLTFEYVKPSQRSYK